MRPHHFILATILLSAVLPLALALPIPSDPAHPGVGLPLLAPPLLTDKGSAWSVAVDSHGNLIIGTGDSKLQKYDSTGHLIWQKIYTDTYAVGVTVDPQDNIIAANTMIRKYAPDGQLLWSVPLSSTGDQATDAQGNIYFSGQEFSANAIAYKLSPSGALLWRTPVSVPSPNGDVARGIAVTSTGYSALVTTDHTVSLDPDGNLLWRTNTPAFRVAIDEDHNVYTGADTQHLAFGLLVNGVVTKFSPTGSVTWTINARGLFFALAGSQLISIDPFRIGGISVVSGVKGWTVDAYDTNTGLWQWGFKHITGTWGGFDGIVWGNAYYRPGYLAITGYGYGPFDTPLYKMDGLAHVCDNTPIVSTPDLARACIFTPV